MKKITPILAKKQPLLWRQAIQQAEHRGKSIRNTLLKPIIDKRFSFKDYSTFLFDYLIIGSNPIITHLLLLKIHDEIEYLNKTNNIQKKYKIGIFLNDEPDYWAYHNFEKNDVWLTLKKNHQINYGLNFQELLEKRTSLFNDQISQECFLIHDNFDLLYLKYDSYVDGYIIHIGNKKEKNYLHNFQPNMPTILKSEHNISNKYKEQLFNYYKSLSRNKSCINELVFSEEKNRCKDSEVESHILLSHKIFLTSQPKDWLYYDVIKTNPNFTCFEYKPENLNQYSFGSAKHIANDFYSLEQQSIQDIIDILSLNIKTLL